MSEESRDGVTLDIEKMLADLPPTRFEYRIFRVHNQLRKQNPDAYEPRAIAIGPYHRGKKHLQAMEEHKPHYLRQFLQRSNGTSLDKYVKAMRDSEKEAREAYAEHVDLSKDEFVKMMLLDGCFISHILRDGPLLNGTLEDKILEDLILFENQLPFFVVEKLIDMAKPEDWPADNIMDLAQRLLRGLFPSTLSVPELPIQVSTKNTLLGFLHGIWCSSFAEQVVSQRKEENPEPESEFPTQVSTKNTRHVGFLHRIWRSSFSELKFTKCTFADQEVVSQRKMGSELIQCTTELREAGIHFKVSSKWLDIKFSSGKRLSSKWLNIKFWSIKLLEIPPLHIDDSAEVVLRNLIAYEQYSSDQRHVTDFIIFMDNLINSAKDVELLRKKEIIVNRLGDDEVVATMFNKLGNQVMLSYNYSYYEVSDEVNRHCAKRWNRVMATLRRNYFNKPWSSIPFLAATLVLLFTLIQTIFSILSYVRKS